MRRLLARTFTVLLCAVLLCVAAAITSPKGFKTLINFDNVNGANSFTPLVQAIDGDFYGTTAAGGAANDGTVFKITPGGTLTTLYSFCTQAGCADGDNPYGGLVQGTDGNLYGTTRNGGVYNFGSIFKLTRGGRLVTLYSFCLQAGCADGAYPYAALIQGLDGNLYGTTQGGGTGNIGTVFRITPSGKLTTLHGFDTYADGSSPQASLVQGVDGNFYGETAFGGANGSYGTVFKITSEGTFNRLYSFCAQSGCTDGANPYSGLVQGIDGNFYGTTSDGGASNNGTVFKITPIGKLTTLYSFCAQGYPCPEGSFPYAALVQATNGNFYGATTNGGFNDYGTLFEITREGALTTLHSFQNIDGREPFGTLIQGTNGSFYGTTTAGGSDDVGTVFRLAVGLNPFVETLPNSGKIGTSVIILGNNLSGATTVSFNGTAATFIVVSNSEIKTTVPVGATSGKVKVTTPCGSLSSNVAFRVTL
jgi:uncharacterized repeat protein (TIGR03803 family)